MCECARKYTRYQFLKKKKKKETEGLDWLNYSCYNFVNFSIILNKYITGKKYNLA